MISYTFSEDLNIIARNKLTGKVQLSFSDSVRISISTFAQVDKDRKSKWKESSEAYSKNALSEQLKVKIKQSEVLKCEINAIYDEIWQTCSLSRYVCILRTMVNLRKKYYQEVIPVHTRKISRLLNREADVDEHILTISSYELSFFQKLVLIRGLKFATPQHVSSIEVKASFERAYWNLELHLNSDITPKNLLLLTYAL